MSPRRLHSNQSEKRGGKKSRTTLNDNDISLPGPSGAVWVNAGLHVCVGPELCMGSGP